MFLSNRVIKGMFKSDPVLCEKCVYRGCIKHRIGKLLRIGHILKADCFWPEKQYEQMEEI